MIEQQQVQIDYSKLNKKLSNLTRLAAMATGSEVVLVNVLNDDNSLSTISNFGLETIEDPIDNTICEFTVEKSTDFEVQDIGQDERFSESYPVDMKYYYGIPVTADSGAFKGTFCVLSTNESILNPEKKEMLKIIVNEVIERIESNGEKEALKEEAEKEENIKRKMSHDVRGSMAGIIGMINLIKDYSTDEKIGEITDFMQLIEESSKKVLKLADEKLSKKNEH
jgi:K+-sensing histidine kinase KdpD